MTKKNNKTIVLTEVTPKEMQAADSSPQALLERGDTLIKEIQDIMKEGNGDILRLAPHMHLLNQKLGELNRLQALLDSALKAIGR